MNAVKMPASIRIDASILETIKAEARSENRSLSNYIETLLYRLGYRPYNEETVQACREAREGKSAGIVDTSSREAIERSLFGDEAED